MNISILGRQYEYREASSDEDPVLKDRDGYCDSSIGLCVVDSMQECQVPDAKKDLGSYKRQVGRHELVHAFLAESGLQDACEWACEEMVDWLACQFPKMVAAFAEAGCEK